LERVALTDDLIGYCSVAPATYWLEPTETLKRLTRLVLHSSYKVRQAALSAVSDLADPWARIPVLRQWIRKEKSIPLVIKVGGRYIASDATWLAWIRKGLASDSPVTRLWATAHLLQLAPKRAALIASQALRDEPDPHIAAALRRAT
jgi:hypothetical protein